MKAAGIWSLSLGLVIAAQLTVRSGSAAAGAPEPSLTLTIHVHNNAQVDNKTVAQAEKVATEIFSKVGVKISWAVGPLSSENRPGNPVDQPSDNFSPIWLTIAPHSMAELNLPSGVMGLTPGMGRNRQLIYVLYNRVEAAYQQQTMARSEGSIYASATRSQILGHAIAHELGHVLLNLESHSKTGIMRGNWNPKDLQDVSYGCLLFTSSQAEVIRAEVRMRVRQQAAMEGAGRESPESAR